jgi:hypothetical protein
MCTVKLIHISKHFPVSMFENPTPFWKLGLLLSGEQPSQLETAYLKPWELVC